MDVGLLYGLVFVVQATIALEELNATTDVFLALDGRQSAAVPDESNDPWVTGAEEHRLHDARGPQMWPLFAHRLDNSDSIRSKRQTEENSSPADDSSTESATDSPDDSAPSDQPLSEIRWITYLFVVAICLLFLIVISVVSFLAYYILSTRILNKNTCKEIELQCRCEECTKDNDNGCD